jgi:hypothetical protein
MSRAIQHNCARSYRWTLAELDAAVDRKADFVLLHEAPAEKGKIRSRDPVYDIGKCKSHSTAVRVRPGLASEAQTDLSSGANDNVMVTDV